MFEKSNDASIQKSEWGRRRGGEGGGGGGEGGGLIRVVN